MQCLKGLSVKQGDRLLRFSTLASKVNINIASLPRQVTKPVTSELHVEKLSNGVQLLSVPTSLPVCRLSFGFRAGVRFEDASTRGITHLLRHNVKHSNTAHTLVLSSLSLSQLGVNLESSVDRDLHIINVDFHRSLFDELIPFLMPALVQPLFYQWELNDTAPFMIQEFDAIRATPAHLIELLHDAAFKGALGHSLFCPTHSVSSFTSEQCFEYFEKFYQPQRTSIVSIGASSAENNTLKKLFGQNNSSVSGYDADHSFKWRGAEIRRENGNPHTMAAIVVQGKGLDDAEALTQSVLAAALGSGDRVKWSDGSATSKLQAAVNEACSEPVIVNSINKQYSGVGLFGFFISGHYDNIGTGIAAAYRAMRTAAKEGLTPQQVEKGKQIVRFELQEASDRYSLLSDRLVHQSLLCEGNNLLPPADAVSKITPEQVNNLFKSLVKGTKAMASMGRLGKVPYKDELDSL